MARKGKRPRLGNATRPSCPNCSTDSRLVFLVAGSSPANVTYYYCPNRCGSSGKVPRPKYCKQTGVWQFGLPQVFTNQDSIS